MGVEVRLESAPHFAHNSGMGRSLQSLIVFVLVLLGLNWFLGEMNYGLHISIVGSIVLTLVVSMIMNGLNR